jgi:hypothetical protein
MENKNLIKNISLIMMLSLFIIATLVLYWLYTIFYSQPAPVEDKSKTSTINDDLYRKIGETQNYGIKVTPEEPGYSRVNPFIPYKEPPPPPAEATATGTAAPSPQ